MILSAGGIAATSSSSPIGRMEHIMANEKAPETKPLSAPESKPAKPDETKGKPKGDNGPPAPDFDAAAKA